jgi:hypothetical protein
MHSDTLVRWLCYLLQMTQPESFGMHVPAFDTCDDDLESFAF